ncbi:hypothetical protein Ancab_029861 [Ancistrocladus abbreviatus]
MLPFSVSFSVSFIAITIVFLYIPYYLPPFSISTHLLLLQRTNQQICRPLLLSQLTRIPEYPLIKQRKTTRNLKEKGDQDQALISLAFLDMPSSPLSLSSLLL